MKKTHYTPNTRWRCGASDQGSDFDERDNNKTDDVRTGVTHTHTHLTAVIFACFFGARVLGRSLCKHKRNNYTSKRIVYTVLPLFFGGKKKKKQPCRTIAHADNIRWRRCDNIL